MPLSTVIALFNIVVGLMVVASVLLMVGGLGLWYVRLGTYPTHRDTAINMMKWAVSILFVLVVLLSVAQYVQTHMAVSLIAIALIAVAGVVYYVAAHSSSGADDEEHA